MKAIKEVLGQFGDAKLFRLDGNLLENLEKVITYCGIKKIKDEIFKRETLNAFEFDLVLFKDCAIHLTMKK